MEHSSENISRILVVDDEKTIQDMLSRHFRFLDYEVEIAENGKEALEIMEKKKCDVVVSDIQMPVMDGVQLLREMRIEYPMTHCIMITGYVTMTNLLACMESGAYTCIFKPIEDIKELDEAVEQALAHTQHWKLKLKNLIDMKPKKLEKSKKEG